MSNSKSYLEREGLFYCTHRKGCNSSSQKTLTRKFGQEIDSRRPTSPKCTFGRSTRVQQPKRYVTKEIAKSDGLGSATPNGPYYLSTDKFSYRKSPQWNISRVPREKLNTQAQYQYYYREDDLDLNKADKSRRNKLGNTKMGSSSRFQNTQRYQNSPGPGYFPEMKPEVKKQPAYSIKMRRNVKGQDLINVVTGTDQNIGPGRYKPQKTKNSTKTKQNPKWTIPHSSRSPHPTSTSLYQTYDTSGSLGKQITSSKSSRPKHTINNSRRSDRCFFSAHMENKPLKVSISQPYF